MRKLWSNTRERTQGNEKDACRTSQGVDSSYPKGIEVLLGDGSEGLSSPRGRRQSYDLHFKIGILVNPDESWSSKTEISGYDPPICPGTFPFL